MPSKVLILGGTNDARRIAQERLALGDDVTTSLAGVTRDPNLPSGKVRTGGFGGADGLRAYLISEKIEVLIDATHPYAAVISANARAAVAGTSVKLEVFQRAAWDLDPGWTEVRDTAEAAKIIPSAGTVFVTVGRRGLTPFFERGDLVGFVRSIEPPDEVLPPNWKLVLQRPPFKIEDEVKFMRDNRIRHLVTKNAGGEGAKAKLLAAKALDVSVIIIARP